MTVYTAAHGRRLLAFTYCILLMLAGLAHGTITVGAQSFDSFRFFQADKNTELDGTFAPVRLNMQHGCTVKMANTTRVDTEVVVLAAWQEAMVAGCFSYAQIISAFAQVPLPQGTVVRGMVFSSSIADDTLPMGSPMVEPYGFYKSVETSACLILTRPATLELMSQSPTVRVTAVSGPWNTLEKSRGYAAQRYLFFTISILLILYIFLEIGLMLCTQTVWNKRMLMYVAAITYLLIFTLLRPYVMNNKAAQMTVFVSWIVGYMSFTIFIVAWGSLVGKIHRYRRTSDAAQHRMFGVSMLFKTWAYAAESHGLVQIVNTVLTFEMPVVFGVQTVLLAMLITAFLTRTFRIAISRYTKAVLRNVAIMCSARFLYSLGQCLLFFAIFAALWIRDHAKRTRPMFHEHEFYVDIDESEHRTIPLEPPSAARFTDADDTSAVMPPEVFDMYDESIFDHESPRQVSPAATIGSQLSHASVWCCEK
ncbi:hypothetical protein DL89DRAFT_286580 [Linderina pennispora]|uniref:TRP C-terminal domain-containing protein n=1 Tax=Linderina pennispora TaxID=61395 RepID=A0A1Y1VXT8_9FUNG|nr:uncharacterized protein DL89DRAFT_286580 [Linderina pennispora]ORX66023.1 hypothetical protein DL89DRAFT_286580 [Linderina pennispora]